VRVAILAVAIAAASAGGFEAGFHGRASGWLGASRDTSFLGVAGLRYLPEARISLPVGSGLALDAEVSVNGFVSAEARSERPDVEARLKPYRGFARLSSARFEARAGLQKISFGSATLLRPLMWFDRVDPRDPLELTDGVYGLLARYYFQNNANVWAWGLLGNSEPKGWEVIGSELWKPEFGGRAQLPVPRGEVAITYHHRRALHETQWIITSFSDDRIGLDGKWDIGVGCWFEAVLLRRGFGEVWRNADWQRMATVGLDYTLGIGAGLSVVAEHSLVGHADYEPFARGTTVHMSVLMLGLPLGLLDNLRGMVYYDWTNGEPYSFLGWQRTLDNWVFSVGAFWNPDEVVSLGGGPTTGVAGKGVRVDVVFNH